MSAGLPGLGLGGLFFILSALVAPLVELVRTARGRSSLAAWRAVGRQFALAVAMIVAVDLSLRVLLMGIAVSGIGDPELDRGLMALPLLPVAITASLLATVLLTAKGLELALRPRAAPVLAPVSALASHPRLLGGTGALAAVWIGLLAFGTSELSPVSGQGVIGGPEIAQGASANEPSPERRERAEAGRDRRGGQRAPVVGREVDSPAPAEAQAIDDSALAPNPAPQPDQGAPPAAPAPSESVPPAGPAPSSPAPTTPAPPGASQAAAQSQAASPGPPPDAGPPEHANAQPHAGASPAAVR